MPTNFLISKQSNKDLTYTNCVYLNPKDMVKLNLRDDDLIVMNEMLIHKVRKDENVNEGTIGTQSLHWAALHIEKEGALGKVVLIDPWVQYKDHDETIAHTVNIVVDTYSKAETHVKAEDLEKYIKQQFQNQIFCKDQRWIIKWGTQVVNWILLRVANIYTDSSSDGASSGNNATKRRNLRSVQFGKISSDETLVTLLQASNPFMKLDQPQGNIVAYGPDWDPETMGIGGLDQQFTTIFRRAFASRLYPPDVIKSLGVKHVKGMLLYGPPGTGKTLIARSIGKMLTDREPQVVNGPEVFSKFVGEAEANIRKLFAEAIDEQKEKGDNSTLHIIIFDEIDAICKQRGTVNSGTGVHDTVVNQLLSMIDGVNALNNILVIGMTNRKDLLDDALLRSGRLEVHIEISLPDEAGREQIFRIHTRSLRENGFLDEKVSLSELAKRTKNYSGAEIEAVVRSAVSYAMQELIDTQNIGKIDPKKLKNIKITQEYFDMALDEVKPDFGIKDDEIQIAFSRGIYQFSPEVTNLLTFTAKLVHTMSNSQSLNRQAMLLQGEMGTGKSAIAAFLAYSTKFPFVRVISADKYVGHGDTAVCLSIAKIFDDAYKSNLSCIIVDDIERLIGYTIGPRFSHPILQALLICIRRVPVDPTRKILIIATSTPDVVRTLEIDKVFDYVDAVPVVTTREEFEKIMTDSKHNELCEPNVKAVVECFPKTKRGIGIADLLTIIEFAIDENRKITPESFKNAWQSKYKKSKFESTYESNILDKFDQKSNLLSTIDNGNNVDNASTDNLE